jgi:hypothetical protein
MTQKNLFDTGATTDVTPKPRKKLVRRGPSPLALEQRFMFDGAAVGDAVQMLASPLADASAHADVRAAEAARTAAPAAELLRFADTAIASAPSLAAAQAEAQRMVGEFLQRPDARAQLFSLFNGGQSQPSTEWLQAADSLLAASRNGDMSVRVELRASNELQGALGAFAAQGPQGTPVIYLNAQYVQSSTAEATNAVLLEELGHAIDHALNGDVDSPGDEGHAFASLVLYGSANLASQLSELDQRVMSPGCLAVPTSEL